MVLPLVLLAKLPNSVIIGSVRPHNGSPIINHVVLSSPCDVESLLTETKDQIIYVLAKGRRSIVFWKFPFSLFNGPAVPPSCSATSSSNQIDRILSFSPDVSKAAVVNFSTEIVIYGLRITQLAIESVIDTAGQAVVAAEFHRSIPDVLVFITQDRTLKIWNVSDPSLIFESHVLSGSIPCSLAVSSFSNQLAVSLNNGTVLGHTLVATRATNSTEMPAIVYQIDLRKKISMFLRKKQPSELVLENVTVSDLNEDLQGKRSRRSIFFSHVYPPTSVQDQDVDIDAQVLSLFYYSKPISDAAQLESLNIHGDKHYSDDIRLFAQYLLILLPFYIIQLNIANLEIDLMIRLPESVLSGKFGAYDDTNTPFCAYTTPGAVTVVSLSLHAEGFSEQPNSVDELATKLNMIAMEGLAPKSVLRTAKVVPNKPNEAAPQLYKSIRQIHRQPGTLDRKGKIVDNQPITFHNKVRSSGYGAATAKPGNLLKKGKPMPGLTNRAASSDANKKSGAKFSEKLASSSTAYPMSGPPPSELTAFLQLTEKPTAVVNLQPSFDGKSLAFSMSDGLVGIVSTKASTDPRMFVHHRQLVRRVAFSKCGSWLAASCEDGTASFWGVDTGERLFELNDDGRPFKKSINHVQFYYLDQFVIVAIGNTLNLYSCAFTTDKSDVKRYQVNSVVKSVAKLSVENAQYISAVSAANTFHSYLCLCAASDHSINIFDLNVCKCIRTIDEAHPKAVHCLAITGDMSQYAAVPQPVYNLYATIAVGDVVKLWDVRETNPVRCFQGHTNRSCPFVSVAFSPCARFIATGSEDRSAYVFDIRADRPLNKLDGGVYRSQSNASVHHSDTVTCVAFNPVRPQIFASTLDGNLYKYSQAGSSTSNND